MSQPLRSEPEPRRHRASLAGVAAVEARRASLPMLGAQCAAIAAVLLVTGCRRDRTVNLEWDAPAVVPARYRIVLDGRTFSEIPPPALDGACRCMKLSLRVPPGEH